jgi:hypothetical protein
MEDIEEGVGSIGISFMEDIARASRISSDRKGV